MYHRHETLHWHHPLHEDYVARCAALAKPFYDTLKKTFYFTWTAAREAAFQALKLRLISPPVLRRPDPSLPYLLATDWCPTALGAVLSQTGLDGEEHPIGYSSRTLRGAEQNYSATEGECLAVVHFIEHWKYILNGAQFTVVTDHHALNWLVSTAHAGRLARWALKLQVYIFTVQYRPGVQNANADALSRPPLAAPTARLATYQLRTPRNTDPLDDPLERVSNEELSPPEDDNASVYIEGREGRPPAEST